MTRDELIEKVANNIAINCGNDYAYECAIDVIDTIFEALKEPTNEMWEVGGKAAHEGKSIFKAMLSASPLAPNNKENK